MIIFYARLIILSSRHGRLSQEEKFARLDVLDDFGGVETPHRVGRPVPFPHMQLPLADEPVEALLSADDFHGHRAADVKAAKPQEEAFEPDLALGAPELVVSYQEEVSCRRLKTIVLLRSS